MPAYDSFSLRGVSAIRNARRFAPYQTLEPLKPYASCPAILPFTQTFSSSFAPTISPDSPQPHSLPNADKCTEISSVATLVDSTFPEKCDTKWDSPIPASFPEKPSKALEKVAKFQSRQLLHQKKADYVSVLIDHTCSCLIEIWPLSEIPTVFRYQSGATFGYTADTNQLKFETCKWPSNCETDLIPLKKFVQELLRRSRSTCSTLQNALCYVEAIKHRIKIAQETEKEGRGIRGDQVKNEGRIVVDETAAYDNRECDSAQPLDLKSKLRRPPSSPKTPLPELPSALLCPRRAFMGALVLSAKFIQDKCYSNKAWAKLCGLPAREVSRCERAIGDALGWRLWVGKDSTSPFAGLESKIGRAPTLLNLEAAIDDKDFPPIRHSVSSAPLIRSHSWASGDAPDTSLGSSSICSSEADAFNSPTPSLTYSSGSSSSSSSCESTGPSPTLPTPSLMFVANDPSSTDNLKIDFNQLHFPAKTSPSNGFGGEVFDADAGMFGAVESLLVSRHEEDVFGIRVGEGIGVA